MRNLDRKRERLEKETRDNNEWVAYQKKLNIQPLTAGEVQSFIASHGLSLREFRRALPGCGASERAIRGIMRLPPEIILTTSRLRRDFLDYVEKQGLQLLREYRERFK